MERERIQDKIIMGARLRTAVGAATAQAGQDSSCWQRRVHDNYGLVLGKARQSPSFLKPTLVLCHTQLISWSNVFFQSSLHWSTDLQDLGRWVRLFFP